MDIIYYLNTKIGAAEVTDAYGKFFFIQIFKTKQLIFKPFSAFQQPVQCETRTGHIRFSGSTAGFQESRFHFHYGPASP